MSTRQTEDRPTQVPHEAKQVGDIQGRWPWVEPSVWTDRMLTALENGVKGGKWYSLMDKVHSMGNLRSAFAMVKANEGAPGVDRQTIEMFEAPLGGSSSVGEISTSGDQASLDSQTWDD